MSFLQPPPLAPILIERAECTLTPAASAFSSILSALVGSVVNGLASGWLVAFATGWIAWMAVFRVLLGGSYMLYRSATNTWGPGKKFDEYISMSGTDGEASNNLIEHRDGNGDWFRAAFQPTTSGPFFTKTLIKSMWPPAADVRGLTTRPTWSADWARNSLAAGHRDIQLDNSVTVLGWVGWVYTALYAPTTQVLFVIANSSRVAGGAKIVKGLTVAITALPLCVDCRVRYADSLKRKWAGRTFNYITALSCLAQGGLCVTLLVQGVIDVSSSWQSPRRGINPIGFVAVIYVVFALIWMTVSFGVLPMRDGGRKRAGKAHWSGIFLDFGAGLFAGLFLAAPAFGLYISSRSNGLEDLGEYLSCETQWLKSFAAIAP
ncbi:hypothetical protein B0T16DRAFT_410889 [Cercophora newfieldiana]|uniref:Uncharacterized protein n=1 Tax=Cercophora newfieldiana TaxID=92897 RepID=A0AA39YC49_9PEZI|nr:hypothetical protein B0T16DRAFT_410889 [Cercophora newfieldiana]